MKPNDNRKSKKRMNFYQQFRDNLSFVLVVSTFQWCLFSILKRMIETKEGLKLFVRLFKIDLREIRLNYWLTWLKIVKNILQLFSRLNCFMFFVLHHQIKLRQLDHQTKKFSSTSLQAVLWSFFFIDWISLWLMTVVNLKWESFIINHSIQKLVKVSVLNIFRLVWKYLD